MIVGLWPFLTLSERKIMAASQRRKGPNVVGFWFTAADRGWFEANR
jgi:NADH:ubiquinone oxidoreductase subunit H